jgi:heterodisulfide reductase subunit B
MSDEKTQSAQPPQPNEQAPAAGPMLFQEMFEEMMRRCGCRPEQMGALWTTCCGQPLEKQEKSRDL